MASDVAVYGKEHRCKYRHEASLKSPFPTVDLTHSFIPACIQDELNTDEISSD